MSRPGSWTRPAGESPVRVGAGAPGSRPRSSREFSPAERGAECHVGGSKSVAVARSPSVSCSLDRETTGEPSRSCHGEGHVHPKKLQRVGWVSPGYGDRHSVSCKLRWACRWKSGQGNGQKQPCSWWPAEGETRLSKRHDKVAMGGKQVFGPYGEESCRVVIPTERGSSPVCRGEDQGQREDLGSAAPVPRRRQGDRNEHTVHRGTGEIRLGTGVAAMDRRSVVPGKSESYKRSTAVKGRIAERKSEEAIGSDEGADNKTRLSEGPLAGCAIRAETAAGLLIAIHPLPFQGARSMDCAIAGGNGQRLWQGGMLLVDCPGASRVRENLMHGSGGGCWKRCAAGSSGGDWQVYPSFRGWKNPCCESRASALPHCSRSGPEQERPVRARPGQARDRSISRW